MNVEDQNTKLKNKEFLTQVLNFYSPNVNSIYFEKDKFVLLSPGIQNDRWSFDLGKNAVEKANLTEKQSYLVIRFFDEFLVKEFKTLSQALLREETQHVYQDGSSKWSMKVEKKSNDYYTYVYGYENKVKLEKYSKDDLVNLFEGKFLGGGIGNIDGEKYTLVNSDEIVNHIIHYLSSKGFLYSEENIKNLYLSLLSKPFIILSGISGTGKTKIVELFAEAVGATYENGRFKLIPVRPDWSDSSDLLGYKDLKNEFIQGPLTKMIIQAHKNPDYPHFVVLDEMNLARVEYYLSDFLSVIESRKFGGSEIKTAPIVEFDGQSYGIPDNLYIIGTVNMDETTHPFSKKVLDRANTIEFNEVHLTNFSFLNDVQERMEPAEAKNDLFKSKYIQLRDAVEYMDVIKAVSEELEQINAILSSIYAQVGYRVRDEIAFYMSYNEEFDLMSRNEAMDFCIMQKILPRISGAGKEVEDVLDNLLTLFTGDLAGESNLSEAVKYPRSATKLKEMKARYGTQGFVSYWIS